MSEEPTKLRVMRLSEDIDLTFKETNKWLWDRKEKLIKGKSPKKIKTKQRRSHLQFHKVEGINKIMPLFEIEKF
jgi:hypothetical protein